MLERPTFRDGSFVCCRGEQLYPSVTARKCEESLFDEKSENTHVKRFEIKKTERGKPTCFTDLHYEKKELGNAYSEGAVEGGAEKHGQ